MGTHSKFFIASNVRCAIVEVLEDRRLLSATISTLFTFDNDPDGSVPTSLVADAAGNLIGATEAGGSNSREFLDSSLFEIAAGTHTSVTLQKFKNTDGFGPGNLVIDQSGNLYGTTTKGGASGGDTVFEIAAGTRTLRTIATFNGLDGAVPTSLIIDAGGNLYGTCDGGGPAFDPAHQQYGNGTVFEISARAHTLITLATFDASMPSPSNLVRDAVGNLFGITNTYNVPQIFEIAAGTHRLASLATIIGAYAPAFMGGSADLQIDAGGNLYGSAGSGVFTVSSRTHEFSMLDAANGRGVPANDLLIAPNGDLYGWSADDTVIKWDTRTTRITTVANLDDFRPLHGHLIADSAGNLYVYQTSFDGDLPTDAGTIYELTGSGFAVAPPAPPTLTRQPADRTGVASGRVIFTAAANGPPEPTVQWQQSTDNGQTFSDIPGNPTAQGPTLIVSGLSLSQSGSQYRAIFTNSLGTVISTAATLTVVPPLYLAVPAHASPATVVKRSARLIALAVDPIGTAIVTYNWTVAKAPAGAPPVTFSTNGNTAAGNTTATFRKAGGYTLRCTVRDTIGQTSRPTLRSPSRRRLSLYE